jgi:hypothetical protein
MYGITSRTIILLGGNVTVAASVDLDSDLALTADGGKLFDAAAALAADVTASATGGQGHFGGANLVAGTACISDEGIAIRMGTSHLTSEIVLVAAGGVVVDADPEAFTSDLDLAAAGGKAFDAGSADLLADLDIDLINPGLVYEADAALSAETAMFTSVSPVFRLILPTGTAVFTRDRLWRRFPIPTGITMLVTGGAVTLKEYVSDLELRQADKFYMGGYRHQISPAERAVIVAAGYGDLIEEA